MSKVKINLLQLWLDHQAMIGKPVSRTELANALNTSRSALDNWMTGDVGSRLDLDLAIRICDYFKVPLSDLIYYEPEKEDDT